MGVQIIHDQRNTFSLRVVDINQVTDLMRPINSRSLIGYFNNPFSLQGFKKHKNITDTITFIFRVVPSDSAWLCRYWLTRVFNIDTEANQAT